MRFVPNIFRLFAFLFLFSATVSQAQNINISFVAQHEPPNSGIAFGDVWGEGDIACLGVWTGYGTHYGVGIYDISNPSVPNLVSIYSFTNASHNQFELGVVRERIGYFGCWNGGGLHIVSLTNAASPKLLSMLGSSGGGHDRVHTLFLERNFIYEAAHVNGENRVKVIDVSNPHAPVFVRNITVLNAYKIHQITAVKKGASTILYTSDFGGGGRPGQTDIWDVSDIGTQNAVHLGTIMSGSSSHSSWPTPDGNTLVVCRETTGGDVRLYDISNPANPVLQCAITPASMGLPSAIPHNPVVVSNLLFLSWYQNGIQIFDITDPTKPVRIGSYDTYPANGTGSFQGNWGVFPNFGLNKLLLSDIQTGLYILDASAVLTETNNYPPLLVNPPVSVTATQGMNATFAATATGSSLSYQWLFNGTNIPGATASSLVVSNVQLSDAGNYSVRVGNALATITSDSASLSIVIPEPPMQVVFFDDFDSVSSSNNWDLFEGSNNGIPDYTADWDFDYSSYFSSFNQMNIPPAPNSAGTTRGLRLTVNNNDGIGATAGVSLYPKGKTFSGAYRLKFDMWMNYPGGAGGTGAGIQGSTQNATFGLNHSGTRVNWHSASPSDGTWFTVTGEGGDTSNNRDYRAYQGNLSGQAALLSFSQSGFGIAGANSQNNSDDYFESVFPSPTFETPGAPGKQWVQVEISQDANKVLKWIMNGKLIAQRVNTSSFTNGNIMIGYMDIFSSIANPAADAFVIFDNVRVEVPIEFAAPQINSHPKNAAVYPGEDATFSVAATGSETLNFQWRFNGAEIPGANGVSLTISNVAPEDVGNYSVVVFNDQGSVTSSNALLTLIDSPYLNTIQASAGARSALISWKSTIPSDSLVQYSAADVVIPNPSGVAAMGVSFGNSSYLDRKITTNHSILLTGLNPGTRYSFQVISTADTNAYVSGVYQFTTAGAVIVDNPDADFTGDWTLANSSIDRFGSNYHFASSIVGLASATATFRPELPADGKYQVDVFYPQGGNRANNAPYTISSVEGEITIPVNQQTGGGSWQSIATREFVRGSSGFVRLANNANPNVVIADAVRFSYIESQDSSNGEVPNWWKNFYFETEIDPSLDHDGDGYSTAEEYVLGTSPTDAESNLQLELQAAGSSANVTFWPYVGNRDYQLLFKTNLNDETWEVVPAGSIMPTPYGHGVFSISGIDANRGFYRLSVKPAVEGDFSAKKMKAFRGIGGQAIGFGEAACGVNRVYVVPVGN